MQLIKRKYIPFFLLFLQGILIGTGAILPGISGGVLCVAFGLYEPIMEFFVHPLQSLRKNSRLFLPILLGGAVGFVLLAKVVEAFLTVSTVAATALFSGLICGTVPELIKKSVFSGPDKKWTGFVITLIASFTFFHMLDSGMQGNIQANFWWYLFCGAIWGLSMVIPGLSSSSILLFMGLYQPMAEGIGNLDFKVILPLLVGFIITILISSRLVSKLLLHHYTAMSRIILGFVLSSVLMITPTSFSSAVELVLGVVCFAAGFLVSRWMDLCKAKQTQNP